MASVVALSCFHFLFFFVGLYCAKECTAREFYGTYAVECYCYRRDVMVRRRRRGRGGPLPVTSREGHGGAGDSKAVHAAFQAGSWAPSRQGGTNVPQHDRTAAGKISSTCDESGGGRKGKGTSVSVNLWGDESDDEDDDAVAGAQADGGEEKKKPTVNIWGDEDDDDDTSEDSSSSNEDTVSTSQPVKKQTVAKRMTAPAAPRKEKPKSARKADGPKSGLSPAMVRGLYAGEDTWGSEEDQRDNRALFFASRVKRRAAGTRHCQCIGQGGAGHAVEAVCRMCGRFICESEWKHQELQQKSGDGKRGSASISKCPFCSFPLDTDPLAMTADMAAHLMRVSLGFPSTPPAACGAGKRAGHGHMDASDVASKQDKARKDAEAAFKRAEEAQEREKTGAGNAILDADEDWYAIAETLEASSGERLVTKKHVGAAADIPRGLRIEGLMLLSEYQLRSLRNAVSDKLRSGEFLVSGGDEAEADALEDFDKIELAIDEVSRRTRVTINFGTGEVKDTNVLVEELEGVRDDDADLEEAVRRSMQAPWVGAIGHEEEELPSLTDLAEFPIDEALLAPPTVTAEESGGMGPCSIVAGNSWVPLNINIQAIAEPEPVAYVMGEAWRDAGSTGRDLKHASGGQDLSLRAQNVMLMVRKHAAADAAKVGRDTGHSDSQATAHGLKPQVFG